MTPQEVFTTVVTHLRNQNAKSTERESGEALCAYRGLHGRKCAVGCLIPDEEYSAKLEKIGPFGLVNKFGKAGLGPVSFKLFSEHGLLLAELQRIHDNTKIENWELYFAILAIEFELELPK